MIPLGSDPRSVLFVNQHYAPDVAATAQSLTDLAEYLADCGFEVTVLCARSAYLSGQLEEPFHEVRNGVRVFRLPTSAFGRGHNLGRILDYLTFFILAFLALVLRPKQPNLTVYLTTPPLLPVLGRTVQSLRGTSYGVWVMDLHPEAEEAIGMIRRGRILSRTLRRIVALGYRGAGFVVDLGPFMKKRLQEHNLPEDVTQRTIPIWSCSGEVYPVPASENYLKRELGLANEFVVMYSGNAGLAHRFEEVLDAMRSLSDHDSIRFLFFGSGPRKEDIVEFVKERCLTNFSYHDYVPREALACSLSLGHLHLLTLRQDMAGIAVPAKLFGIMAVARPVLMVGPRASEPAQIITSVDCGWVIDPKRDSDPVQRIVSLIQRLETDRQIGVRKGWRGFEAFEARFSANRLLPAWLELLSSQMHGRDNSGEPRRDGLPEV